MKVLHFNAVRKLTAGQKKQLIYEYNAAKKVDNFEWDVVVLNDFEKDFLFMKLIPPIFRNQLLRKLYAWYFLLTIRNKYDFILLRHMTFDPYLLFFGWFVKNRISIHHSKEINELKIIKRDIRGKLLSFIESIFGRLNLIQVKGILCVTKEIEIYEKSLVNKKIKSFCYPNGINVDSVQMINDFREDKNIHIAFVCGNFNEWHGLDRLVSTVNTVSELNFDFKIIFHLIGNLSTTLSKIVEDVKHPSILFIKYGHLNYKEYTGILSKCDLGIASLALDRLGLTEASTLKVREYLSMGLPVYSNFKDTSIPDSFVYFFKSDLNIFSIINFAFKMKSFSRQDVRNMSEIYISKLVIINRVKNWLTNNFYSIHS